jgi:hypothetical protein
VKIRLNTAEHNLKTAEQAEKSGREVIKPREKAAKGQSRRTRLQKGLSSPKEGADMPPDYLVGGQHDNLLH